MIFGVDISKYQGPTAMDGYAFAILNVEDPTIEAKINRAYDLGIRWDIYKWCYPGQTGPYMLDRARSIVNRYHRPGTRRPQFWLDYEEAGVQPWQIDQWYEACDFHGERTGLYIYLYLMNNQGVSFTRDGWLAYYPGNNSGDYYESMSDTARARGAKIHQFTSSAGRLDVNVVLDEAWYGAAPAPAPAPAPDWDAIRRYLDEIASEDAMKFLYCDDDGFFVKGGMLYLASDELGLVECPGVKAADVFGASKVTNTALDNFVSALLQKAA